MSPPELILTAIGGYLALGVLVAAGFLTAGVQRVDPAAEGAWAFRILILPGCVALWPIVLRRWLRGGPAADTEATP